MMLGHALHVDTGFSHKCHSPRVCEAHLSSFTSPSDSNLKPPRSKRFWRRVEDTNADVGSQVRVFNEVGDAVLEGRLRLAVVEQVVEKSSADGEKRLGGEAEQSARAICRRVA